MNLEDLANRDKKLREARDKKWRNLEETIIQLAREQYRLMENHYCCGRTTPELEAQIKGYDQ